MLLDDKTGDSQTIERIIYDGDIDPSATKGECKIESVANGGFQIKIEKEDEFGFTSECKIIFDKQDLEVIQSLKNQGLI